MKGKELAELLLSDFKLIIATQNHPEKNKAALLDLFNHLNTVTCSEQNGWYLFFAYPQFFTSGTQIGWVITGLKMLKGEVDVSGLIYEHGKGSALYWACHHPSLKFRRGDEIINILKKTHPALLTTPEFLAALTLKVKAAGEVLGLGKPQTESILEYLVAVHPFMVRSLFKRNLHAQTDKTMIEAKKIATRKIKADQERPLELSGLVATPNTQFKAALTFADQQPASSEASPANQIAHLSSSPTRAKPAELYQDLRSAVAALS